jgi:metal-responsive CopG/Arc/MetJ family transcriptional regulator
VKVEDRIAVSVVIDEKLLAEIDVHAKAQDMNRSQYLRKIAREAIAKQSKPQEVAA